MTIHLPLAGMVDLEAEKKRLQKELENLEKQIQRISGMLNNPAM